MPSRSWFQERWPQLSWIKAWSCKKRPYQVSSVALWMNKNKNNQLFSSPFLSISSLSPSISRRFVAGEPDMLLPLWRPDSDFKLEPLAKCAKMAATTWLLCVSRSLLRSKLRFTNDTRSTNSRSTNPSATCRQLPPHIYVNNYAMLDITGTATATMSKFQRDSIQDYRDYQMVP